MHDAVKNATYTYSYKQDGNLASDSRKGVSVAYNVLGLPRTVTSGTTVLSHYEYLRDVQRLRNGVLPGRLAREGLPWQHEARCEHHFSLDPRLCPAAF